MAGVVLLAVVLAALSALGVAAIGTAVERVADILIPGRKTGLGAEGIVGEEGVVAREFAAAAPGGHPEGMVQVAGELWRARCAASRSPVLGSSVRVTEVQGMVAIVEPSGPVQ